MLNSMTQQKQIWEKILNRVKEKLQRDPQLYQTFFASTLLHHIENDVLTVIVDSAVSKGFFQDANLGYGTLSSVVNEVMETNYRLEFRTKDEVAKEQEKKQEEKKSPFFSHCFLNSRYTFDTFVQGDSNKEAVQASLLIVTNPYVSYNPLFIYSKSGLGKTHLLHAVGNYYKEKNPGKNVLYISTDDFINEFVRYVRGEQDTENLRDYFKTIDLLLVDDVQFLKDKAKTCEMFFNVFNSLVNSGKQIVLTSDRHPNELQGLEDRLVSRFNMGLSVSIQAPNTETLLKILEKKITASQLDIRNFDVDGLLFLAENFSKNVRELEGALNRVLFHTINVKHLTRIDVDTVKESVRPMLRNKNDISALTEEDIIDAVAEFYNMTDAQIKSKVRTSQIALARRIAMYLCREFLNTPYLRIGKLFGGRDHSTVITAVVKVETELKTDTQLAKAISEIKKRLKK